MLLLLLNITHVTVMNVQWNTSFNLQLIFIRTTVTDVSVFAFPLALNKDVIFVPDGMLPHPRPPATQPSTMFTVTSDPSLST